MHAKLIDSLSQLSKLHRKFPFAKNVAVLSGGASLGHCFSLAAAPVLTRLYSPSDIGRLSLFIAFLNVAAIAASLQYDVAVVVATDEREAAHLATVAMLLVLPVSLAGGLLLCTLSHFSITGFGILPAYATGLMIFGIVCIGLFQIVRYWSIRVEKFSAVSQALVLQNGGRSISQVALGALGTHLPGLLAGEVLGRCLGMGRMMRYTWPAVRAYGITYTEALNVIRKHRRFALFFFPSSLLNQVGTSLPLLLLVALYGANIGGYYSLVWRCLSVPAVLLGTSVADAFHSRAARLAREDTTRVLSLFQSATAALLAIGIIPALTLFVYGGPLFQFVFGSKWRLSGSMAAIMAPWFLATFVVSPLTRIVYVLQGQRVKLVFDILTVFGNLSVFELAHKLEWPVLHTIAVLSIINTGSILLYYLVLLRIATTSARAASNRPVIA
jgi:lipopolysaccharide exporter